MFNDFHSTAGKETKINTTVFFSSEFNSLDFSAEKLRTCCLKSEEKKMYLVINDDGEKFFTILGKILELSVLFITTLQMTLT